MFGRTNSAAGRRNSLVRAAHTVVEALEGRYLLSVSLDSGMLSVGGGPAHDDINLSINAADASKLDVTVNGDTQSFALADIQQINILAGRAADRVTLDARLEIGASIMGARGADTLVGSGGNDTITGGRGSDFIKGNGGTDVLYGGMGADRIIGEDSDDQVRGGPGANIINAGGSVSGTGSINHGAAGLYVPFYVVQPQANNRFPTGLVPSQIRNAYAFGDLNDAGYTNRGAGQTIVIIDAYDYPTAAADLAVFSQTFGLPQANLEVHYASGRQPVMDEGWAGEAALDLQWAHAIAPEAKLILVEADSALSMDIIPAYRMAAELAHANGGGVVSMSFGTPAAAMGAWIPMPNEAQQFTDIARQYPDVSFVAAAGDTAGEIAYPAIDPNVLSVGGTMLPVDENGELMDQEAMWVDTGGGIAVDAAGVMVPAPGYQIGVIDRTLGYVISATNARVAPDVAYNADPLSGVAVYSSTPFDGFTGWQAVGGTSAGAPQWAGIVALANQLRVQAGKSTLGTHLNPAVYHIAQYNRDAAFTDIVPRATETDPRVARGFDEATGFGSPNADALIPDLVNTDTRYISTTLSWSATLTKPTSSHDLPGILTFSNGSGSINGGSNLSMVLSPQPSDPTGQPITPLPVSQWKFSVDSIVIYQTYRRADNSVYGVAAITFTYQVDGVVYTVANTIHIEGQISTGADGTEHIRGDFFNVDANGDPAQAGWSPTEVKIQGQFEG